MVAKYSDEARAAFAAKGLTYNDITSGDILALVLILNRRLKKDKNPSGINLRLSEKIDSKYRSNGGLVSCYLYCNGRYFTRREAISFNTDGFIGFCGWADEQNTKPFTDAFLEWVEGLSIC